MMDAGVIEDLKRSYRHVSIEYLIESIRGF